MSRKLFFVILLLFPCSATIVISNLVNTFEQETVNARLDTTYYSTLRTVKVAMSQNFGNTSALQRGEHQQLLGSRLAIGWAKNKNKFHV